MIDQMKRLKRELKYKGSILDIYQDTMEFANGKQEKWDFVSHRMGAAERETIEIPAGARDSKTEDTKVCATRELEEETGYRSENVEFLLSLRTTVAFCDEHVDVYLATDLEKIGEQHLDDAESIDIEIYTLDELCKMIYEGKIEDSKTVAAIMAYGNKLRG